MTRPRSSRRAVDAAYAMAIAENATLRGQEALGRIAEIGALARLALEIHNSPSPDDHPRLAELMTRRDALARARRTRVR